VSLGVRGAKAPVSTEKLGGYGRVHVEDQAASYLRMRMNIAFVPYPHTEIPRVFDGSQNLETGGRNSGR
jgi:hypothetical protein